MEFAFALAVACLPATAMAQEGLPAPYGAPEHQFASPPSGQRGSTAGIERGPRGEIWAINRCGANSCDGSDQGPIVMLDMNTGQTIKAIGAGLFVFPHGLHVVCSIDIKQLVTLTAPVRYLATSTRDLESTGLYSGERADEHFETAGLVGRVGEPLAVR